MVSKQSREFFFFLVRSLRKINVSAGGYERKSVRNVNYYLEGEFRIKKKIGLRSVMFFFASIALQHFFDNFNIFLTPSASRCVRFMAFSRHFKNR